MAAIVENVRSLFVAPSSFDGKGKKQDRSILITAAAVACAVLPFDTFQILVLLSGALAYAALQSVHKGAQKKPVRNKAVSSATVPCPTNTGLKAAKLGCQVPAEAARYCRPTVQARMAMPSSIPTVSTDAAEKSAKAFGEMRTQSAAPVSAPTFTTSQWDGQVTELLGQITPTDDGKKAVQEIAALVQRLLRQVLPEAEVISYASSSFTGRQAFAVAVPEVDIVLNINPTALKNRLLPQQRGQATDAWKLQKTALRTCVSHLVSVGRFKFRRSAFKSDEPKVTLLAPDSFSSAYGLLEEGIPVDFSINSVTPLCNAALVMECGQVQPRGKDLILLVKRWAKHRGICHQAKGHLPPYAWSILCIHFLQAGGNEGAALLPGVEHFQSAAGLVKEADGSRGKTTEVANSDSHHVAYEGTAGDLLKAFFAFFNSFEWQQAEVSIRGGQKPVRSSEALVSSPSKSAKVNVRVQDPFDSQRNVADCLSASGMDRLKEELARANTICSKGASLTELLEPWAPAASTAGGEADASDNEGGADENVERKAQVSPSKSSSGSSSPPWRRLQERPAVQPMVR
eukprot:CAMPEP_0178400080 /NCGR_PEP_ID=MMETSP0689_2-20121128/15606_1 /TAXON_ID=160604 /ORGANISM="Amphidinium massartii, Strain CS-259" /LENGTH=570 /DNA_ID=CAMNT_0020020867 /DNA_START=150 /DNA_END=1862 /DNA_ORIENTATION=+